MDILIGVRKKWLSVLIGERKLPKNEMCHLSWDKLKRKTCHLKWDGGSSSYYGFSSNVRYLFCNRSMLI